jgi:hypothetical protein
MFYPIWEAASLDEWLYNGGPYQLIVCHFFLGICCYMGREWELSYRLGMQKFKQFYCFAFDASPEENQQILLDLGELPRNRQSKNFKLPNSTTFNLIIKARQKNNRDVYLEFMKKISEKQKNYEKRFLITKQNKKKVCYVLKKTQKFVYLEKHRVVPGHENGKYTTENTLLLTFQEHVMAHYLRFLQYKKQEDFMSLSLMLSTSTEEARRIRASIAGSIGGKKQQELLREQNRGWYNSEVQSQLGKKGAENARKLGVGAFDQTNKSQADAAWKQKYQTDKTFQNKMKMNLQKGLETQREEGKNIHNPLSQRIRSVNYRGILIGTKRLATPYQSYSLETGKFEYTESRVHMSEDFYWYYLLYGKK